MFDGTALRFQEGNDFRRRGMTKVQIEPATHKITSLRWHHTTAEREAQGRTERGWQTVSEQEKKMLAILVEKARQVTPEQEKLALAYMAGLADGARSVQSGEKAG